jgi:hypothetical protein
MIGRVKICEKLPDMTPNRMLLDVSLLSKQKKN